MILAAGRGERMRPLTDSVPKPLLKAGNKPLLQYHIENLAAAGITEIVINTGRLGEQIEEGFGHGREDGPKIRYSHEGEAPLETGGGIRHALPLLGKDPFIVVNADIWTDFDFAALPRTIADEAHLVMVANPPHHPDGDFVLRNGRVSENGVSRLTYAGIGVFRPALFESAKERIFPLAPLLCEAMRRGQVSGELFAGTWLDVGTPDRLRELRGLLEPGK